MDAQVVQLRTGGDISSGRLVEGLGFKIYGLGFSCLGFKALGFGPKV